MTSAPSPRRSLRRLSGVLAALALAGAAACSDVREARPVAVPLTLEAGSAYEEAARVTLPERAPEEPEGLHNVYALSDDIISGGEPHDRDALAAIAAMGVKTILSVDGKAPDAEGAEALGMRYVHVPIQYKGLTRDEILKIAKTFTEAEGPFYVHCFHGKHRGPAAAAVGRLVLDGAPREQAIAEMRQWCGTSKTYEGLYRTVATAAMPGDDELDDFDWELESQQAFDGVRDLMIRISRHWDNVEGMAKRDWQVNPDHPDVDPANEAAVLRGLFEQMAELPEVGAAADDYRGWVRDSVERSAALREAYLGRRQAGGEDAGASTEAFSELKASCTACHDAYRNS